jgi:hypothetical protein
MGSTGGSISASESSSHRIIISDAVYTSINHNSQEKC